MSNFDFENIVGQIMPNIFISQVRMESVGGSLSPKQDNPHITDEPGESPRSVGDNRSLKVTVNATLKDIAKKGSVNQWFRKNKFTDHLSCVVMCSTHKAVTNLLLQLDNDGDRGHLIGSHGDFEAGSLGFGSFASNVRNALDQRTGLGRLLAEHLRVHKTSVEPDGGVHTQTDSLGREIFNFPLQATFDQGLGMESSKPRHLTIFAYTFFEIDEYFKSLNLNDQILNNLENLSRMAIGAIAVQNVINNFKIVNDGFIFRRQDNGQIYVGPYHRMASGGYMAGAAHTDGQPILIPEVVPNSAIQDFRNFEELRPNTLDLSAFESELFPSQDRFFNEYIKNNLETKDKVEFFSDIWMSRGLSGECRFAFAVDLKKIIKKNTKYSWLLDRQPELINTNFKILSLKVVRSRVQETEDGVVPFDGGDYGKAIGASFDAGSIYDLPEIIISTSQSPTTANILQVEGENSFREMNLFFQRGNPTDARTYSVTDGDIAKTNVGKYQYGVEIEIEDLLVNFIKQKMDELLKLQSVLSAYLARATGAPGDTYDLLSNRFTQSFIQSEGDTMLILRPLFGNLGQILILFAPSGGWPQHPQHYIKMFKELVRPSTGSPDGIQSVITFVSEMATELGRLIGTKPINKDLGIGGTPPVLGQAAGLRSGAPSPKTFTVAHRFTNDLFDASFPKNTGYDFLVPEENDINQTRNNVTGLRSIFSSEFQGRITLESNKYIREGNDISPDDPYKNLSITESDKFKYLSPSVAFLDNPGGNIFLLEEGIPITENQNNYDFNKFNSFTAQLANLKSPLGQRYVQVSRKDDSQPSIRDNLVEVLADKNCTVETVDLERLGQATRQIDQQNFRDALGANNPMVQQIADTEIGEEFSAGDIVGIHTTEDTDIFSPTEIFTSLLFNFILESEDFSRPQNEAGERIRKVMLQHFDLQSNSFAAQRASLDSARQIPYHIKSLMLSSVSGVREQLNYSILDFNENVLANPSKAVAYHLNFLKLMKLEYFFGFGGEGLKREIWADLSPQVLEESVSDSKELLVKMTPYDNDAFKIRAIPGLDLVNFDQYFIIRPSFESVDIARPASLAPKQNIEVLNLELPAEAVSTDPRVLNEIRSTPSGGLLGSQEERAELSSDTSGRQESATTTTAGQESITLRIPSGTNRGGGY